MELVVYITCGIAWALWNSTSWFSRRVANENPEWMNFVSFVFAVFTWPLGLMITLAGFIALAISRRK